VLARFSREKLRKLTGRRGGVGGRGHVGNVNFIKANTSEKSRGGISSSREITGDYWKSRINGSENQVQKERKVQNGGSIL